mgnify:CR=1 FL=1
MLSRLFHFELLQTALSVIAGLVLSTAWHYVAFGGHLQPLADALVVVFPRQTTFTVFFLTDEAIHHNTITFSST